MLGGAYLGSVAPGQIPRGITVPVPVDTLFTEPTNPNIVRRMPKKSERMSPNIVRRV